VTPGQPVGSAVSPYLQGEDTTVLTQADREAYGDELLNMTQRAAVDAVGPQLAELRTSGRTSESVCARAPCGDV